MCGSEIVVVVFKFRFILSSYPRIIDSDRGELDLGIAFGQNLAILPR